MWGDRVWVWVSSLYSNPHPHPRASSETDLCISRRSERRLHWHETFDDVQCIIVSDHLDFFSKDSIRARKKDRRPPGNRQPMLTTLTIDQETRLTAELFVERWDECAIFFLKLNNYQVLESKSSCQETSIDFFRWAATLAVKLVMSTRRFNVSISLECWRDQTNNESSVAEEFWQR